MRQDARQRELPAIPIIATPADDHGHVRAELDATGAGTGTGPTLTPEPPVGDCSGGGGDGAGSNRGLGVGVRGLAAGDAADDAAGPAALSESVCTTGAVLWDGAIVCAAMLGRGHPALGLAPALARARRCKVCRMCRRPLLKVLPSLDYRKFDPELHPMPLWVTPHRNGDVDTILTVPNLR